MTYDRKAIVAELIRDEGLRLRVYRCTAGKLSIGVGRNLDDVGLSAEECRTLGLTLAGVKAKGLTERQALALLDTDIYRAERDLDRRLSWWRTLDPVRQRVLVNMCLNMGIGSAKKGLLSFVNTLAAIRAGAWDRAAAGMLASKWRDEVGQRAVRLAAMMRTGHA